MTGLLLLALTVSLPAAEGPSPRVLIVGIDGCRPDALEKARTPHVDALAANGTRFTATDIQKADRVGGSDTVSGPGWTNILTGVFPDKHGVRDNSFEGRQLDRHPTVYGRLKQARPRAFTASYTTWPPMKDMLATDADVAEDFYPEMKDYTLSDYRPSDDAAADAAVALLSANTEAADPTLVVFYQGQADVAGHELGFHPSVPEYVESLERVDANIGRVLQAIEQRPSRADEDWLILVCTDHGGRGTGHGRGAEVPEIRNVFLIVSGEAAAKGVSDAATWQVDVVPTTLTHLGVPIDPAWELDGRPIGLKAVPALTDADAHAQ